MLGLLLTGATDALTVDDAGALTRWGLPVARVLNDVAASLTVGLLVLAAVALPAGPGRRSRGSGSPTSGIRHAPSPVIDGTSLAVVRLAGATALVWAAAGAVVLVLSYARLSGVAPGAPGFAQQLGNFLTEIDLLRALLISSLVVVVVATGAIVATRLNTVGWMAALAVGALLPVALTGHAAGSTDHELAVDSLAFHLVGVTVWVGGLAALMLLRAALAAGDLDVVVVRRYSTLALWAFVAVGGVGRGQRLAAAGRLVRAVHPVRRAGAGQGRRARPARARRARPPAAHDRADVGGSSGATSAARARSPRSGSW